MTVTKTPPLILSEYSRQRSVVSTSFRQQDAGTRAHAPRTSGLNSAKTFELLVRSLLNLSSGPAVLSLQ